MYYKWLDYGDVVSTGYMIVRQDTENVITILDITHWYGIRRYRIGEPRNFALGVQAAKDKGYLIPYDYVDPNTILKEIL